MSRAPRLLVLPALILSFAAVRPVAAQQQAALEAGLRVATLRAEPAELSLTAGQAVAFRVVALDVNGAEVENAVVRVTARRSGEGAVLVRGDSVMAISAGANLIVATVVLPPDAGREPARLEVPVIVSWPAIARVDVAAENHALYTSTTLRHRAAAFHADGSERPQPEIAWSTSDESIATVDRFGNVTAHGPGRVTVTAAVEGLGGSVTHTVRAFPAASLRLTPGAASVRTGDVVTLDAIAVTEDGRRITDAPVDYTFTFTPDDSIRAPGAAGIIRNNRFVGEVPGTYIVSAFAGPLVARAAIDVRPRAAVREIEFVGHGPVREVHTSDLWVWRGVDGRDYAVTGTWGADGWAYFWDVTDPSNIVKTDSVRVDARTVNDVKVSPDGRYAAISREGASNRRNGLVILDLSEPAHPTIASRYDDVTGGVHNLFATDDYLYALSNGEKFVVIDVRDIHAPVFAGEYDHPDSRVHDIWVEDGLAYTSEWQTGVVIVDVGNGRWGGSPQNPVYVTNIPYPVGRTHAAFPYRQPATGRMYLFLGDEIIGRGEGAAWRGPPNQGQKGGVPEVTSGYYHVIDVTDPMNPEDVARYEVAEFGTHNLWIEDDILFAAYYEGGVRMVDVSGELLGNLAEQGREIAVFKSYDPEGFIANAAMVWGAQPHGGHIFFADHYSGLWAARLLPKAEESS